MRFDVGPKILSNPFHVSTHVGDSIVAKRVYRNCPIYISHSHSCYLVDLDKLDFDVILGMHWLYACYVSIDYRTGSVTFKILNEPIMPLEKGNYAFKGQFIFILKI